MQLIQQKLKTYSYTYIAVDLSSTELNSMEIYIPYTHWHKLLTVIHVEGFSFQVKVVTFPLLNNYKLTFRTFGPLQYSTNIK